jgi:hypothetical protein
VQHETAEPSAHDVEAGSRPVAGTVRIMTEEPLEVSPDPREDERAPWQRELRRRPWIVPAVLLGAAAAYFLLRRR